MNRSFFWLLVPPFVIIFLLFIKEQSIGWIPAYEGKVSKEMLLGFCALLFLLQISVIVYLKRRSRKRKEEANED